MTDPALAQIPFAGIPFAQLAPWLPALAAATVALLLVDVGLVLFVLVRRPRRDLDLVALTGRLDALAGVHERSARELREEVTANRRELGEAFGKFAESVEQRLERLRGTIDAKLQQIQQESAAKLDQMRAAVDEKLQGTLEKRLAESFHQVSTRLEQVHKGLGEMQQLATGVGDLKRVLSNVKQRGTWGEVQLGHLLEQVLAPGQYEANVAVRPGSGERVEFAVRLPGRDGGEKPVWLPIDAKFPLEDYQRLVEAGERGDADAVDAAGRALELRIRDCAKEIQAKYVDPPHTTDFGILFLPTEGLYAEALRRPGLSDALQREQRVVIAGPTTLWALLSSLQMGFRTLQIEKRSSEVWKVLGAVKTEFGRFGGLLEGVQRKLQEATNKMDDVAKKTRTIGQRLRDVEALPAGESRLLLPGLDETCDEDR
ncbi:MAG TPA: DNA recombination protein RmuC [Myxococcota bacterium]|jgi:DNA recombination protein RmuC|nr:DNA recombination protein RmuC [Myxococcota bacterium]